MTFTVEIITDYPGFKLGDKKKLSYSVAKNLVDKGIGKIIQDKQVDFVAEIDRLNAVILEKDNEIDRLNELLSKQKAGRPKKEVK
jgi:hypothetical protein